MVLPVLFYAFHYWHRQSVYTFRWVCNSPALIYIIINLTNEPLWGENKSLLSISPKILHCFSSLFSSLEVIITSMVDAFPGIQSRRAFLSFGTCLVVFLLGLPCVTRVNLSILNRSLLSEIIILFTYHVCVYVCEGRNILGDANRPVFCHLGSASIGTDRDYRLLLHIW